MRVHVRYDRETAELYSVSELKKMHQGELINVQIHDSGEDATNIVYAHIMCDDGRIRTFPIQNIRKA